MRDGADVTLFLPTDELAAIPARPNAPAKRRKPMLEHPALDLYAGNAKYLVRTAIIRSEDWNSKAPTRDAPTIRSSRDIAELTAHLAYADQEHMVSIALNNSMKLLAIHEVAVGHTSGVSQELRHIVKVAFLTSASVMAVVHNHPSGTAAPSPEDIQITKALMAGMECMGLKMIDHVIVATGGNFSFLDAGLL